MEQLFSTVFDSILDHVKKPLSTARGLALGGLGYGLYWVGNSTPEGPALILAACKGTEAALEGCRAGLAAFLCLFAALFFIFRHSDKKFRRESEEVFPDSEVFESKDARPLRTKIVESYDEGKRRRFIKIENTLPHAIEYAKGCVIFSRNGTINFTVPFEVKVPVRPGDGYRVTDGPVGGTDYGWTSFRVFVEEMSAGGRTEKRLELHGCHVRRMRLHFLLNHYNYLPWLPFLGRYELSWVIHAWRYHLSPWLRYFPTKPRPQEWFLPRLRDEVAAEALPRYAARLVRRPRAVGLEPVTAAAHEAVTINYCLYSSWLEGAWLARARIGGRLVLYARRKLNQLIWLTTVLTAGGFVAFGFGSLCLFVWRLALLWGGVAKYGILVRLQLQ